MIVFPAVEVDYASEVISSIVAWASLSPLLVFLFVTVSHGRRHAAMSSKSFSFPVGPSSFLTISIAACRPASLHYIASNKHLTLVWAFFNWQSTFSAHFTTHTCAARCCVTNIPSLKLLWPLHWEECRKTSCFLTSQPMCPYQHVDSQ